MNPQLICIGGSMKGSTVPLPEGELTVGRDTTNGFCIPESSVSRHHCVIRCRSGMVSIVDLESRNGTVINDLPVREHLLAHGDRIRLGGSHFVFLSEGSDCHQALAPALVDDDDSVNARTVMISMQDAPYPRSDGAIATLPPTERTLRDLNTLLKISTTLNSIRSLEDLERRLLELTFEIIPAERGAILMLNVDCEADASIFTLDRDPARLLPLR